MAGAGARPGSRPRDVSVGCGAGPRGLGVLWVAGAALCQRHALEPPVLPQTEGPPPLCLVVFPPPISLLGAGIWPLGARKSVPALENAQKLDHGASEWMAFSSAPSPSSIYDDVNPYLRRWASGPC